MKKWKKAIAMLLGFCLCIGTMLTHGTTEVKAEHPPRLASTKWSSTDKKIKICVRDYRYNFIEEIMENTEYSIQNLQVDKEGLRAWNASETMRTRGEAKTKIEKRVYVGLLANKSGIYQVNYDICDAIGNVVKTRSITVYANNDMPFKSIKVNGEKATATKGSYQKTWDGDSDSVKVKLSIKMNPGYKLKKIEWESFVSGADGRKGITKNKRKVNAGKNAHFIKYKISYIDAYTGKTKKSTCSISIF